MAYLSKYKGEQIDAVVQTATSNDRGISSLPPADDLSGDELLILVQAGVAKQIRADQVSGGKIYVEDDGNGNIIIGEGM